MKNQAQLILGVLQDIFLFFRKVAPGAIDVKVEHRHGGLVWARLAAMAVLGGTFEGEGDAMGVRLFEDRRLQIHGVAVPGDAGGPVFFGSFHKGAGG